MVEKGLIFWLGASLGSFINVLVGRFGKKKEIDIGGRSRCDFCDRPLSWWENIPLLSFLLLRGRCRTCHSPIPRRYFLVELITGLLFLLMAHYQMESISYFIVTLLIIIFLFDLDYQIIPDWATLSLVVITIVEQCFRNSGAPILKFFLTGLAAAAFFLFLHLITKGRGMGLGDVKFAFFMGFFLGPAKTILALYLAFLTGAIVGVILILIKRKRFGQQIAFGPFLIGATLISWIEGESLINFLLKWINF